MAWVERSTGLTPAQNQWWLTFGIDTGDVVVAYQPLGADDIAGSYVNLATPGVNNATPIVAPTFATGTGWTFTGTQHLTTGVTGTGLQTIIARVSDIVGSGTEVLSAQVGAQFQYLTMAPFGPGSFTSGGGYNISTATSVISDFTDNIAAIARNKTYFKGTLEDTIGTLDTWSIGTITIANDTVSGSVKFEGIIKAYAIYNRELTAAEIVSIGANMLALTSSDDPTPAITPVNYIVQNPATKRLNSSSHELWLAGDDGIFRTFNGGRGWAKITLPDPSNSEFSDSPAATVDELTFHWIDYDPTDQAILYVMATKASVNRMWIYKTTDLGETWTSRGVITV